MEKPSIQTNLEGGMINPTRITTMNHSTPLMISVLLKIEAGVEPKVWKTGATGDATIKISSTATMQDVYAALDAYAASDLSAATQLPGFDNRLQTTTAVSENTATIDRITFEGQTVANNLDPATMHLKDGEPFQANGSLMIKLTTSHTNKTSCCAIA